MRDPWAMAFRLQRGRVKISLSLAEAVPSQRSFSLIKHVQHPDLRKDYGKIFRVVYGTRNSGMCMYKPELASWHEMHDMQVHQAIDVAEDGWAHHVGYVPDVVRQVSPDPQNAVAVVCGPPIMTRYTLPALVELGFEPKDIFTSLEKRMKCGIGKCGRCNIGPKYICKDGPVFSLAELNALPADI